ncbi:MAG: hypothetical protein J6B02_00175 [Selenomonadales bacterium]|nr:hypothetical protein [Selenomonadales bacterium]
MKRILAIMTAVLVLSLPSVCSAESELRLSSDEGAKRAELWLGGQMLIRLVIAETVPVWAGDDAGRTIWLAPRIEGGMLKIIVR